MKHTEEYLQAKWVTKNPDGYDERDVVDAKRYCNAYLDGYNQALRTPDIVGQSEQFCECDGVQDLIVGTGECRKCGGQCTY